MRIATVLAFTGILSTCGSDETISGYIDTSAEFALTEIGGVPYTARATIAFPEQGLARGTGPCNAWSATQTAPYPWLALGAIAATRRACPELAQETEYFAALAEMTLIEALGDVVLLSDDTGKEMVFRKVQADPER